MLELWGRGAYFEPHLSRDTAYLYNCATVQLEKMEHHLRLMNISTPRNNWKEFQAHSMHK